MSGDPDQEAYQYWAFISYSHQDRAWGDWLHRRLETYRIPRRLVGRNSRDGPLPRRLYPVFRDRDELPSSADLGGVINAALRQSRYLVVICSPQSANSRWVDEEIRYFKSLGRADRVLCFIVSGEPDAASRPELGLPECFPAAVRFEVDANAGITTRRAEPVAADARGGQDGRDKALLKLIAGLIGVSFDDLRQRERQRRLVQRLLSVSAACALSLLALIGWRWQQAEKHQALEAQTLQSRLVQLYQDGRKEYLAHNEARAAVYLNEAYKLGLDMPALRYLLGRAMRAVDAEALRVQTGALVLMADIDRDGKRLLSVGSNRILSLWDAKTGAKLREQDLGDAISVTAEFGAGGSLIWVSTRHVSAPEQRLRLFDAMTGELLMQLEPNARASAIVVSPPLDASDRRVTLVRSDRSIAVITLDSHRQLTIPGQYSTARFCNDGHSLITGAQDGLVTLVDDRSGRLLRPFGGLKDTVVAVDSSADCRTLAAGTASGAVRVWDTRTGETLMTGGHSEAIASLIMSEDGARLMSSTRSGLNLWDGHSGALIYASRFQDPDSVLGTMSRDGQQLAITNGVRLAVIDPLSGNEVYSLDGHRGPARASRFRRDHRQLVSGGSDGTVVLWNLPQIPLASLSHQREARIPSGPSDPGDAVVAFSHDGARLATGGPDGRIRLWDAKSGESLSSLKPGVAAVTALAFSADDQLLASGGSDQSVQLWNVDTGALLRTIDRLGAGVVRLAFNRAGTAVSAQIVGGIAKLLDPVTGRELASFERDAQWAQAFSADGSAYLFGNEGVVKSWDIASNSLRWSTPLPADEASGNAVGIIAASADGASILATLQRHKLFMLDARDGHILRQIDDPAVGDLYVGEMSRDGRRAVFGDSGKSVRIWQIAENRVLALPGHASVVRAVALSEDNALIASAGADGIAKIWDAKTDELLDSITAHHGAIGWGAAVFSSDRETLLTGGADQFARLWSAGPEVRSPFAIAAILQCRVPWRLVGSQLISTDLSELQNCAQPLP